MGGDQDDEGEVEVQDKVVENADPVKEDEKTPIQKLVEERFARPATEETRLLPKPEQTNAVEEESRVVEKSNNSKVTDSIDYLLEKAFPVKEGVMPSSSGPKESLVTGGLRHVVGGGGGAEDKK